ncbi:hypothetical protein SDC9_107215 [bioreactor metagenome]|uniref:Uncharacterized protein n=1 Tax=bioreactor metagenome TaxID=1076179 RepID=A0A645BF76_9ZZZZ
MPDARVHDVPLARCALAKAAGRGRRFQAAITAQIAHQIRPEAAAGALCLQQFLLAGVQRAPAEWHAARAIVGEDQALLHVAARIKLICRAALGLCGAIADRAPLRVGHWRVCGEWQQVGEHLARPMAGFIRGDIYRVAAVAGVAADDLPVARDDAADDAIHGALEGVERAARVEVPAARVQRRMPQVLPHGIHARKGIAPGLRAKQPAFVVGLGAGATTEVHDEVRHVLPRCGIVLRVPVGGERQLAHGVGVGFVVAHCVVRAHAVGHGGLQVGCPILPRQGGRRGLPGRALVDPRGRVGGGVEHHAVRQARDGAGRAGNLRRCAECAVGQQQVVGTAAGLLALRALCHAGRIQPGAFRIGLHQVGARVVQQGECGLSFAGLETIDPLEEVAARRHLCAPDGRTAQGGHAIGMQASGGERATLARQAGAAARGLKGQPDGVVGQSLGCK